MKNIKIIIPTLTIGILVGFLLFKWTSNPSAHQPISTSSEEIWTCSMHPQIRQNEAGLCPICEMDLVPLISNSENNNPTILQMSLDAVKLAQVETTVVGGIVNNGDGQSSIRVDGTIELDERSIHSQSAHIDGRIEEINVTFEGEYVTKGQKIAKIYSTELLSASQELITASEFENKVNGITDASIQKLKNWNITDEQIQDILTSRKPIETIDIFADHSGYILKRNVALGDYLRQGQTMYTIGQISKLWLLFNVFESDLKNIRIGQRIKFSTPSLGEQKFNARISYIEPLLDPSSRTAIVRAEYSNPGGVLKPGMLLEGEIQHAPVTNATGTISIPSSAVLWTGKKSVVYVQLPEEEIPTYQFREIQIGEESGNTTIVSSGLQNGEIVITNGAFAIDAAAQLNNNMSMMNKNVSIRKSEDFKLPNFREVAPMEFKQQLEDLTNQYLLLKNAFVETDAIKATKEVTAFLNVISKFEMNLLSGESHDYWIEQMNAMINHGRLIENAGDIEEQRKQFDFLSKALINSLKVYGIAEVTFYIQHCPMAFNNDGADWISDVPEISNPYFGDKMHKCGSVKETISVSNL